MTTISDFYTKLEAHDWTYEWSDDGTAYRRGQAERDMLNRIKRESAEHLALYDAMHNYYMDPQVPRDQKPARPSPEITG